MATISENYLSRPFTVGKQSGRELVYDIHGTDDEAAVEALLLATAPATYSGLEMESVEGEPLGNGFWKGHVRYLRVNDNEYTFDIGGGTQRITQSIQTMDSYAASGFTAPDFGGAIGVTEDRVEGVDIPASKSSFTETHSFADATITTSYKIALEALVGRFNDATFRGRAVGEVVFLGATGSKRGDERWIITFRFDVQPNATGLSVGTITGIDKRGWDYLWVRYATFEDATAYSLVQRPVAAYVEQVLYPGDFTALGI